MRPRGSPAELEHRRTLAVERMLEGYEVEEIAAFLAVDPSSIRRWRAQFDAGGWRALEAHFGAGRPPRLSCTQEKIVRRWLRSSAAELGFPTDLWSAPRLAKVIAEEFGLSFHPDYLGVWLRSRGYSPQKPQRVAYERDPEQVAAWLEYDWPRIKKKAARQHAALALMDESGVLMTPLVRRSWSLRGHPPSMKQKMSKREKISVAAALWMPPSRDRLEWFSQTLVNSYYDNECIALFVQGLLAEVGQRLVLVWDGGPMHRGGPIPELVRTQADRLTLEPLPPYAPDLNPVEPAWSWLKYGRLCNFAPRDVEQLHDAVLSGLRYLHHNRNMLRGFFEASKLPFPRALIT